MFHECEYDDDPLWIMLQCRAWLRLRHRIRSGEFDVVLRVLPVVAVIPSPFAFFLRKGPIPFVIGPLNGGLPWPTGFPQLDQQRKAAGWWVSSLRGLYPYLPFSRSTYAKAAAIVAGSSHTYNEFAVYQEKLFFVPGESGIEPALCERLTGRDPRRRGEKLELIFVGRLIPFKACDLALRAAAPLLRADAAHFTVVGDGAERESLGKLSKALGIEDSVTFTGWLSVSETMAQRADVLVFPSVREFGGAVIFEALALGAVPVVADFGGPGDIVNPAIGYKIPLVDEDHLVLKLEAILKHLSEDRDHLETLRRQGMAYAREHLTWDGKARVMSKILLWVTGRGAKPTLPPPERVSPSDG